MGDFKMCGWGAIGQPFSIYTTPILTGINFIKAYVNALSMILSDTMMHK